MANPRAVLGDGSRSAEAESEQTRIFGVGTELGQKTSFALGGISLGLLSRRECKKAFEKLHKNFNVMIFQSRLPNPARPTLDVCSHIFESRRNYPPDKVLYKTDRNSETLTLAQLEQRTRKLAWTLVNRFRIKRGETVAILARDSLLYPVVYLAILAAGATVELIPVQKELTTNDVVARMKQAETKLIVADSVFLTMAAVASASLGGIPLFLPETEHGLFEPEVPEYHEFKIDTEEEAQNSVAFVNRTSGSTGGKLKTVITTHAHFIAALVATLHTVPKNTNPDTDTWLSSLSFGFFINSKLHIGLNILLGIPVVIMDTVFGPDTLDIVQRHRVTFLFVPPPVAASFAKLDSSRKSVDVSSIKWLLSAGASMHEGLQQTTSQKLNGVHLDLEWGTSETLLIAIQMDGHASPAGSSGVLVNGIEAKVIDTVTHEELEAGESGEIYIRNTACRFAGYKANDTANRETFDSEGWFHSGDYGYIDDDRNVFITDRLKELIRVGGGYGVHISGTELESVIFSHPAVSQVVVTGVPDAAAGVERPTAFVILTPEWQEKQDEALTSLRQWVRERLTGLQTLNGGFFCLTEFPLIGFKINRRALKSFAVNSRLKDKADARTMSRNSVVMPELVRVA